MKIVGLQAENFKRLRAISIHPNGDPLVRIVGKNAQGKTSALD
jgi:recombinational DNA repair ATPase RecF